MIPMHSNLFKMPGSVQVSEVELSSQLVTRIENILVPFIYQYAILNVLIFNVMTYRFRLQCREKRE